MILMRLQSLMKSWQVGLDHINICKIFMTFLMSVVFIDLGFVGNKFTWHKNISNRHTIWERLDRAVGTQSWLSLFPATKVVTLECGTSDHKPIIIHPMGISDRKNHHSLQQNVFSVTKKFITKSPVFRH